VTSNLIADLFRKATASGTMRSHANRPVSSAKNIPKKRAATAARSLETEKSSLSCRKRKTNIGDLQRRQTIVVEVVGGRTFPGELARKIIAGYRNPRVNPTISRNPTNRHDYWCSRNQAGSVLAKCIPRHLSESFVKSLTCLQANFDDRNPASHPTVLPSVIPHGAKIGRTFVANIHQAFEDIFGDDNVSLERCDHMNSDRSLQTLFRQGASHP
jgi:hypothetical protein